MKTTTHDGEEFVDISQELIAYTKRAHAEFMEAWEHTNLFTMSFSHGETFTVRVLGFSEHSTEYDPCVDVIVISQHGKPRGSRWVGNKSVEDWSHQIGQRRWVRTYDLTSKEPEQMVTFETLRDLRNVEVSE